MLPDPDMALFERIIGLWGAVGQVRGRIFVHISAMPGGSLTFGQRVAFEIDIEPDGRKRAPAITLLD